MDPLLLAALGAIIAGLIGVVRAYAPDLPPKFVPLFVIVLSAAFLAVGINSGEIEGGFTLRTIIDVLNQALIALGVGRGVTQIAGVNEAGVPRMAAVAHQTLPGAPAPTTSQVMPAGAVPPREPVITQDPPPTLGQPPAAP